MAEEKKAWGGKREGAGRPPERIRIGRKFSIKAGQTVLTVLKTPEGHVVGGLQKATIGLEGDTRNRAIILEFENGDELQIMLMS